MVEKLFAGRRANATHFVHHHQMTVPIYFDHMNVDLWILYSQAVLPHALRSKEVGLYWYEKTSILLTSAMAACSQRYSKRKTNPKTGETSLLLKILWKYMRLIVMTTWTYISREELATWFVFKFPHLQFGDFFLPIIRLTALCDSYQRQTLCPFIAGPLQCILDSLGRFEPTQDLREKFSWNARLPGHRWPVGEQMLQLLRILKAENCGKKGVSFFKWMLQFIHPKDPKVLQRCISITKYYKYAACI